MNNRLQELTDKIYLEGISKGQEEADLVITKAKAEALLIVDKARKEADELLLQANKKAAELSENTRSEIKLAARQALDALKLEIVNLINGAVVSADIKDAVNDSHFIQSLIGTMIKNWSVSSGTNSELKILIPQKEEQTIKNYISTITKGLLEKGFKIESVNGLKSGFQIASDKGGYKISFTEQDFIAYFQEYLRPKIVELLFNKK